MTLPLALLRGLFTVAGWAACAAPLAFLGLMGLLAVEALLSLVHVPSFSESAAGDRLLGYLLAAGATVTGAALAVSLALWLLLPAIELRVAEAVASRERLSAQDRRRIAVPAAQRLVLTLGAMTAVLLVLGAIITALAALEDDPESGGRAGAVLGLVPGVIALCLVVIARRMVGARAGRRHGALDSAWPAVASRPESVHEILVREHREAGQGTHSSPSHGRRRADARSAGPTPARPTAALVLLGAGFAGLVLSDVLEYDGALLGIPFALLLAGIVALVVRAVRRSQISARNWALAAGGEGAGSASAHEYTRRHPSSLPAAVLALIAALALTGATAALWLAATDPASTFIAEGSALGAFGVALLVAAVGCSAHEHRRTRAWRERFLLAHPQLDPFWTPDLQHDGLQAIHGRLNSAGPDPR
jgi:hypothetical protein